MRIAYVTCVALFAVVFSSAYAAETAEAPVSVGGFIEVRAAGSSAGMAASGVGINDAAIYFKKSFENGEVVVDFPFQAGLTNSGSDFTLGTGKAQAYVSSRVGSSFRVKAGQFDLLYGFEGPDSPDRRFANFGIVSNMLASVHTGVLLGYDYSDTIAVNMYAAKPNAAGAVLADGVEAGGQVTCGFMGVRCSAGYMYHSDKRYTVNNVDSLANVVVGYTVESLSADLDTNFRKTIGFEQMAIGTALHLGYKLTDVIDTGARLEYAKNAVVSDSLIDTQTAITVGPQFNLNKNLKLGIDYTLQTAKADATSSTEAVHLAGASLVCKF